MDILNTYHIKLVILFGSQATGRASKQSDTDIAVLADHSLNWEERNAIIDEIARRWNISEDKMDLVDLWNAPPLLQHEIAKTGHLLHGAEFDFLRFRVLAWKRYQDTAKFRRTREQMIKSYVERLHPQKT